MKNDRTVAGLSERRKMSPASSTATREPRSRQRGYHLTRHAQQRSSQRAIRAIHIQLIQVFGVDHVQKGGSVVSFIPEQFISQLRTAIDRCAGISIVKANDESVVTVMHSHRRVATTEWSA